MGKIDFVAAAVSPLIFFAQQLYSVVFCEDLIKVDGVRSSLKSAKEHSI